MESSSKNQTSEEPTAEDFKKVQEMFNRQVVECDYLVSEGMKVDGIFIKEEDL